MACLDDAVTGDVAGKAPVPSKVERANKSQVAAGASMFSEQLRRGNKKGRSSQRSPPAAAQGAVLPEGIERTHIRMAPGWLKLVQVQAR